MALNTFLTLLLFGISLSTPKVFLSCAGDDVRKSFSDHLYAHLNREGIHTFREEDGIPTGEKVDLTIQKMLHHTKVAVVIFSKDYPKSKDCLDELVMIIELVGIDQLKLVPVYLNVNRKDVIMQSGPYYEAFVLLERQLKAKRDIVEKYRIAFKEAGQVQGPSLMNGYETQFIEKVVQEVKSLLKREEPKGWNNLLLAGGILFFAIVVVKVCRQLLGKLNLQKILEVLKLLKEVLRQEDGRERSSDASSACLVSNNSIA